jgi:heat-inducible transcriptional repressor
MSASIPDASQILSQMTDRSREVFRRVVEGYLMTGDPVGSRALTRTMSEKVSAATIRNVMQDLEYLGLLDSPHISAGRVPTQAGLRMFVDAVMEVGRVDDGDRARIEEAVETPFPDVTATLDQVGATLSGLTRAASIVFIPSSEAPIRHIEFVGLAADRTLVVLVRADGQVENRIFTPPPGLTPTAMREAANLLNALAEGRTLSDLRRTIAADVAARRQEIDALATALIDAGLAVWDNPGDPFERLIVRGTANLLDRAQAADLERIGHLFDDLERKREIVDILELTEAGQGVRIFIGSENKLFSLSGSSLVVSPYMNADRRIIGAVGVIGPTRLNYGRIVPIVDYTAQLVGRLVADRAKGEGR